MRMFYKVVVFVLVSFGSFWMIENLVRTPLLCLIVFTCKGFS